MTWWDPDHATELLGVEVADDIDDALFLSRPDIEHFVWRLISRLSKANIILWTYGISEVDRQPGWAISTFLQVDTRGPNRERALVLADESRRLIKALPWIYWDGGIVAAVDLLDGPRWEPDQDGMPRYVARYSIVTHPHQRRSPATPQPRTAA